MKKLLFILGAIFMGLTPICAQQFSAVNSDGKTIFYTVKNSVNNEVEVAKSPNDNRYSGEINIPKTVVYNNITYSVTSLAWASFLGCSNVTSVTLPNSITEISAWAFNACSGLTSITIPNRVRTIGASAFGNCNNLVSVSFPNSLASIESSLFESCTSLRSVMLGDSIRTIGNRAFFDCRNLTSIVMPNVVTMIGDEAFSGCARMNSLEILAVTPPTIYANTFHEVDSTIDVFVPSASLSAYQSDTSWSYFTDIQSSSNLYHIDALSSNLTRGRVTGSNQYSRYSVASLRAIAYEGYRFDGWDDGNISNPRPIRVTSDMCFIATFVCEGSDSLSINDTIFVHDTVSMRDTIFMHDTVEVEDEKYNLVVSSADENLGMGVGSGSYVEGHEIWIVGLPKEEKRFAGWSDGNIDNPRKVVISQESCAVTYVAQFDSEGIEEIAEVQAIEVYPNPTLGTVKISSEEVIHIEVYNVMGVKVAQYNNQNELNLSNLSAGNYTLFITIPEGTALRRVIKK